MLLNVGIDAALVLGPTISFHQLQTKQTLLSNGLGVVKCWDGCSCCLGADEFF